MIGSPQPIHQKFSSAIMSEDQPKKSLKLLTGLAQESLEQNSNSSKNKMADPSLQNQVKHLRRNCEKILFVSQEFDLNQAKPLIKSPTQLLETLEETKQEQKAEAEHGEGDQIEGEGNLV